MADRTARGEHRSSAPTVDVELVDEADHGHRTGQRPDRREPTPRPDGWAARRRRARWAGVALVTCVGVVLGAGALVEQRERAALSAVGGLLHPLPEQPVELWEVRGEWLAQAHDGALLRDERGLVLVDHATGVEIWRVPHEPSDRDSYYSECGSHESGRGWFGEPTAQPVDRVLCRTVEWVREPDTESIAMDAALHTSIDVVDLADGAVRRLLDRPGQPTTLDTVDGDIVVVTQERSRTTVTRVDPVTGVVVWEVVHEADELDDAVDAWPPTWQVSDGTGVLDGPGVLVGIALADGTLTELAERPPFVTERPLSLPGTALLRTVWDDPDIRTELVDADGEVRLALDGALYPPNVVDPRSAVLVLSDFDRLVGIDLATGEELWEESGSAGVPALQVDDVVVVRGVGEGRSTRALDAADGTELWTAGVGDWWSGPLSDGQVVLLADEEDTRSGLLGPSHLVALGLHDGEPRWRVELPGRNARVWVSGGLLMAEGAGLVRAYGLRD